MLMQELAVTRQWHWGIAIVGDPAGNIPDLDGESLVTVGEDTVILLVHHAQDVGLDEDLASSTLRVRVLDAVEPNDRTVVCDVVLDTPSRAVSLGDADEEVKVTGLTTRTRLIASAEDVRAFGLDEVWIDLVVL